MREYRKKEVQARDEDVQEPDNSDERHRLPQLVLLERTEANAFVHVLRRCAPVTSGAPVPPVDRGNTEAATRSLPRELRGLFQTISGASPCSDA